MGISRVHFIAVGRLNFTQAAFFIALKPVNMKKIITFDNLINTVHYICIVNNLG